MDFFLDQGCDQLNKGMSYFLVRFVLNNNYSADDRISLTYCECDYILFIICRTCLVIFGRIVARLKLHRSWFRWTVAIVFINTAKCYLFTTKGNQYRMHLTTLVNYHVYMFNCISEVRINEKIFKKKTRTCFRTGFLLSYLNCVWSTQILQ